MKRNLLVLAALTALLSTACQHVNPKTATGVPPPPPSPAVEAPVSAPSGAPTTAPAPPEPVPVEPVKPETKAEATAAPVETSAPAAATPAPTPVRKPQNVAPVSAPPPAPTPAPPPVPAPHIEASLPQAQRDAYKHRAESAISESRHNIEALKRARLNSDDQGTLSQARTFLGDAEKAMKSGDVVRAATLAEKARLLTGEILKRLEG